MGDIDEYQCQRTAAIPNSISDIPSASNDFRTDYDCQAAPF